MLNILFSRPKVCWLISREAEKGFTALDIILNEATVQ